MSRSPWRRPTTWLAVVALIAVSALAWVIVQPPAPTPVRATVQGLRPRADIAGFERVTAPRTLAFPADHGPHTGFQTEWWYYTGNVQTSSGRAFGYQFTIFRRALAPAAPAGGSLSSNQIYFAHFAVSDVAAGTHQAFERFSRGAGGLAGASADPFRVTLEDWSIVGPDAASVRVQAHQENWAIDLTLEAAKPLTLHGDRGLSQKSPEPGNASFYYSFTRMATQGRMTTPAGSFDVGGESWMDHEWSTSVLSQDTRGWDWFALQLNDGSELMYYRLWQADGSDNPATSGTWVLADGTRQTLSRVDVALSALDKWTSPTTGATYPSGWRLSVPSRGLDLTITPRMRDQEMRLSTTYWEGAVSIEGTLAGKPIKGRGYVELTGYAAPITDRL